MLVTLGFYLHGDFVKNTDIAIPFDYCSLDRACELLEDYGINCSKDDIFMLWEQNKIKLCYDWTGKYKDIEGLVCPLYSQVMWSYHQGFVFDDTPILVSKYNGGEKIYSIITTQNSEEYGVYTNFRPVEDLIIVKDELLTLYYLFINPDSIPQHKNKERFAENRSRMYMQAIRVLIEHEEECKDAKSGKVIQSKWANAINAHQDKYGYLAICSLETIADLLGKAMRVTNLKK
ncbi:hypothetical protein PGS49_03400 [Yersinia intermedia]|uniref:hypothetical protein n=1 Tax=Yersinia intermedia TaxID=631 RepID=UPI0022FE097C|nr:hypothetical protein [Yersinia intermedia]MDA5479707.1 hypothetical protein [Yersinia intermedia]